jgi:GNAT superfamily N-acetyltransferase
MYSVNVVEYPILFEKYKTIEMFFPLIGAVLLGRQNGSVYVDDPNYPEQVYVEHKFGFAQIFGRKNEDFEAGLKNYLLEKRNFLAAKVRLYGTYLPAFLKAVELKEMRSIRQRFTLPPTSETIYKLRQGSSGSEFAEIEVNNENIERIEGKFGVVNRFWRNSEEFIGNANATVVLYRQRYAGICYAAAQAANRVEIDVLTLPEYRNLGVGMFAVNRFVQKCFKQSIEPLWDCFTNNEGSMNLCKTVGFVPASKPYPFYTIVRKDLRES